ncbi:hypothetical protein, partial [Bordetella pertussis]|uniref:hypothetical protein n=1 Tax=Bordetella pertussis TaxID=520 RepID=UPI001C9E4FE2
ARGGGLALPPVPGGLTRSNCPFSMRLAQGQRRQQRAQRAPQPPSGRRGLGWLAGTRDSGH